MNHSPAFQFYPADFLADANVALMSLEGRGAYITLICYCWREGSIPSDLARLGRLCGVDSSAMAQLWPELEPCFEKAEDRYYQPRLERERIKQQEYRTERQESGRKGAISRWEKTKELEVEAEGSAGSTGDGEPSNAEDSSANSSAIAQNDAELLANDGPSVFSLQSSSSSSEEEKREASRGKPRSAQRPVICDEEFLEELQGNPAYAAFDVRTLYHRMVAWCGVHGKQPTRRRLVNWLNREEKPMAISSPPKGMQNGRVHSPQASDTRTTEDFGIRTPPGI
jgi:uncharacterized protein YdaU (DUF1376 family)